VICKICGQEYEKWLPPLQLENEMCLGCNEAAWEAFDEEHADDYHKIAELKKAGHPHHCACRQVWGDGECECDLYPKGYDPYAWNKPTL
jgi:hypothetical protein